MKKTVLITGASGGIGRATTLYFQTKGWNVVATMRSPERETELAKLNNILCTELDVTKPETITRAVEAGIKHFGAIDAVVNNAGFGLLGPFEKTPEEEIQRQFQTNVFGLMNVTRAVLPHLRNRKQGTIINVASVGGRVTFPLYSLYHASKWAVEGFSESLQFELKPLGIRVKIVEPGAIKTNFYDTSVASISPELDAYSDYVARVTAHMRSFAESGSTPEAVARTIYRATTDASSRLRYVIGRDARVFLFLRKILPLCLLTSLSQAFLTRKPSTT